MSDPRLAAAMFLAALLARILSSLGSAFFSADGASFLQMADWMRDGRFHDALLIAYHPLYPLLVAVGRSFGTPTAASGVWVSILLGSAATVPLFYVVRTIFGRPVSFIATLIYAFHPRIVEVQSDTMTEGTFMFFFLAAMWLTWRMMEEPSLDLGGSLGMAAAGAFLTRPEGLLSLALAGFWPGVTLFRGPGQWRKRASGLLVAVAVAILLVSPYLLWVRSVRGHWAWSVRPSFFSAEDALGMTESKAGSPPGNPDGGARLYKLYASAILRLTLYGALLPLYFLGLFRLREIGIRGALFYFSFPLGLMGGILFTLRTHNAMSERYLMLAMTLMSALAGRGAVAVLRWAAGRWPEAGWRWAASAGFVFLIAVLPGIRWFRLRRQECVTYPLAAQWILSQGPRPRAITSLEPEVGYLTGTRFLSAVATAQELERQIKVLGVEYYVYSERDRVTRREFLQLLEASGELESPVEISGPPGGEKLYIQRVKRH